MELTVLDRSNYFRGLLLLAGKDQLLSENEIRIMKGVGNSLGFDKNFSDESINNVLENEHISNEPPTFSDITITKNFLKDGIKLALADNSFAPEEMQWLKSVASRNNIKESWFLNQLKDSVVEEEYKSKLSIISITSVFL